MITESIELSLQFAISNPPQKTLKTLHRENRIKSLNFYVQRENKIDQEGFSVKNSFLGKKKTGRENMKNGKGMFHLPYLLNWVIK